MTDTPVIEAQLLRWSESHNGRTVTLQLPADGEHPFRGLPCGPANGARLAIAIARIADDETTTPVEPVVRNDRTTEPPSQAPEKPASGGNGSGAGKHRLAQQAGILCQEPAFAVFLEDAYGTFLVCDDHGAINTAGTLRRLCAVDSRRELDEIEDAGKEFRRIKSDYDLWLKGL